MVRSHKHTYTYIRMYARTRQIDGVMLVFPFDPLIRRLRLSPAVHASNDTRPLQPPAYMGASVCVLCVSIYVCVHRCVIYACVHVYVCCVCMPRKGTRTCARTRSCPCLASESRGFARAFAQQDRRCLLRILVRL